MSEKLGIFRIERVQVQHLQLLNMLHYIYLSYHSPPLQRSTLQNCFPDYSASGYQEHYALYRQRVCGKYQGLLSAQRYRYHRAYVYRKAGRWRVCKVRTCVRNLCSNLLYPYLHGDENPQIARKEIGRLQLLHNMRITV